MVALGISDPSTVPSTSPNAKAVPAKASVALSILCASKNSARRTWLPLGQLCLFFSEMPKKKDGDEDRRRWKLMRIGSFRVFELIWEAPGDEKGNLMGWSGAFVSEAKSNSLEVLFFCCRVGELEDIWNLSFNQRFSSAQLQSIIHIHLHNHIQYTWWNMITVWHAKSV